MQLPVVKHEDNRRTLVEWVKDIPFKRAKVLHVKEKCQLGNHYHEHSDSVFYLLKGKARYEFRPVQSGKRVEIGWMFDGDCQFVPKNVAHTFEIWPDSILLEAATEPYNANDEIPYK